jgi:hypothetical protein
MKRVEEAGAGLVLDDQVVALKHAPPFGGLNPTPLLAVGPGLQPGELRGMGRERLQGGGLQPGAWCGPSVDHPVPSQGIASGRAPVSRFHFRCVNRVYKGEQASCGLVPGCFRRRERDESHD